MEKLASNKQEKTIKLDQKDKKILEILNLDARASIAKISRKTGIQRDSVLYRINKMKKQKVIRFFHTVLNPTIIKHPVYSFVNFVLFNLSNKDEKAFKGFLTAHPNVVYVAKTTGKWDFTINVAAKDLTHFDNILREIRMKFSNIIKDYETASIIEECKYDNMLDLI